MMHVMANKFEMSVLRWAGALAMTRATISSTNEFEMLVLRWTGASAVTRAVVSSADGFGVSVLDRAWASVVVHLGVVLVSGLGVVVVTFGILVLRWMYLMIGRLSIKTKNSSVEDPNRRTFCCPLPCDFSRTPGGG